MPKEVVCHEFPAVGKYRVRLVKEDLKAPVALDVREYIKGREFQGFTRRGIKLSTTREVMELRDHLNVVLSMLEVKS
jgi:hypothetical protein